MSEQRIAAAWAGGASALRSTPRAYEPVAHELLVLILGGHFGVGDRLPSERQLASRFGVSRPTVREALSVLEARGLVVTRKGSGTFVADREGFGEAADGPPDDSPVDFMETRLVLEVAVARLAGKRARSNRDGLEEVRVSVEALERIADPEALPDELDRDFHRALARLTGNDYLIRLLEPMWETMSQALFITLGRRTWSARSHAPHRGRAPRDLRGAVGRGPGARGIRDGAPPAAGSWRPCSRTRRSKGRRLASLPRCSPRPTASCCPTTVTGSWPRPVWFTGGLWRRSPSDALADTRYREEFTDAVSSVISDQERAGLDIFTNGDYHLDADLGGRSWMRYPVERLAGIASDEALPASDEWVYPPGSLLAEVFGAWRLPPVVGRVEPGGPLEFDKLWRIAQARTDRPVKFGTVSTQFVASMLELRTDEYAPNKRELMWDMATVMNGELRTLADAGCKVIQIEEPLHAPRRRHVARRAVSGLPDRLLQPRDRGARGRRGVDPHLLGEREHAARAAEHVLRRGDRDLPRARRLATSGRSR